MKLWKAVAAAAAMVLGSPAMAAANFDLGDTGATRIYGSADIFTQAFTLEWTAISLGDAVTPYTITYSYIYDIGAGPNNPTNYLTINYNASAAGTPTRQRLVIGYNYYGKSFSALIANPAGGGTIRFSNLMATEGTFGDVGEALPEPSTWALMLLGFGAVGQAARRRPARAIAA